jgi:hypothetical protein
LAPFYPANAKGISRWGDIGGASVDPDQTGSIWVVHQYANGSNDYGFVIAKVTP